MKASGQLCTGYFLMFFVLLVSVCALLTGGLAIGVRWDVSARDLDHSSQPVENVQDGDELLLVRLVAHVDILHHAVVGSLLAVLLLEASAANSRFGEPIFIWICRAGEDETQRGLGGLLVDLDCKE